MLIVGWTEGGIGSFVWECSVCGFDWDTVDGYWTRVYGYLLGIMREKLHDLDSKLARIPTPS